jgi:hypothetical protein
MDGWMTSGRHLSLTSNIYQLEYNSKDMFSHVDETVFFVQV